MLLENVGEICYKEQYGICLSVRKYEVMDNMFLWRKKGYSGSYADKRALIFTTTPGITFSDVVAKAEQQEEGAAFDTELQIARLKAENERLRAENQELRNKRTEGLA